MQLVDRTWCPITGKHAGEVVACTAHLQIGLLHNDNGRYSYGQMHRHTNCVYHLLTHTSLVLLRVVRTRHGKHEGGQQCPPVFYDCSQQL